MNEKGAHAKCYTQSREKGFNLKGRAIRKGFSPEEVQAVLDAKGRLPMYELLRSGDPTD